MNTLPHTLRSAERQASQLTSELREAHRLTCGSVNARETIANTYLLQLIQEAANLETKIKAILP